MLAPLSKFIFTHDVTALPLQTIMVKRIIVKASGPFSYRFLHPGLEGNSIPVSMPEEWKEKEIYIGNNPNMEFMAVPDTTLDIFKLA